VPEQTDAQAWDDGATDPATPDLLVPAMTEDVPDELESLAAAQMLTVNARRVVLAGTIAFGVAFVALLPFWSWLGSHDHRVWLWTSMTGAVLGALSLPLVDRHRRLGRLG
jgi:Protein of unknown function (DUF2530)